MLQQWFLLAVVEYAKLKLGVTRPVAPDGDVGVAASGKPEGAAAAAMWAG
jgi:hypothetical protein